MVKISGPELVVLTEFDCTLDLLKCDFNNKDLTFPMIPLSDFEGISCLIPEFELDQYRYPVMDRKVDGDASEAALLKFADVSLGEIMSINFIKRRRIPKS